MNLTPRTLGLAVAATVTGCTVLGIMTSLDLASAHPNAHNAPAAGPATALPSLAAALGDSAVTATEIASPPREASPTATVPGPPTESASASDDRVPSPGDTTPDGPSPTPARTAAPRPTPTPPPPPSTTPAARPAPAASPSASRPRRPVIRRTTVRNSWQAPVLQAGATTLTVPRLTSGAPVAVTVACSPRSGCVIAGPQLQVATGTSVTLTWTAPARPGYTAWRTSRVL
ncbi:MAG: hypothetical protein K9G80_05095 [Candidatus Nanopelagicales bacterium]|nr:hypothetical protein [Candidatus Nanopelagicales bacterium]MCF8536433.1 hypothetical protein [Candidatus Nanopelagicales bacterium]